MRNRVGPPALIQRSTTAYPSGGAETERLLGIAGAAGADRYPSGPSAQAYFDEPLFKAAGIVLEGMSYEGYPEYPQLPGGFEHGVTVLDLLFTAGLQARRYLKPTASPTKNLDGFGLSKVVARGICCRTMESESMNRLSGISVVVPVYNNAPLIGQLVEGIVTSIARTGEPFDLLLVEDGSQDTSWDAIVTAASLCPHVKGFRLSRNFGQQIAVSAGIAQARRAYIIVMDGDLQNPASAIPEIVAALRAGNELVYTVSKVRNNARDAATSKLFWFVLTRIFRARIVKHQLMMKGMTSRVAGVYNSYPEITRTVAGIIADMGYKSTVVEVENARRAEGKSGYGFFKRFDLMINMVISIAEAPLKILIYASLAIFTLTLVASIFFLTMALFHSIASGTTVVILAIFFFGSLITLILGIVGVYLANIYTEVRRRPLFLIAEETD